MAPMARKNPLFLQFKQQKGRNLQTENSQQTRGILIIILIAVVMLVYVGRLFAIQVISSRYASRAENIVRKEKSVIPPRGNLYDRNQKLYVTTSPMFELAITPRNLVIPDTARLCDALEISKEELYRRFTKLRASRSYSPFKESVLARFIEPEKHAQLQERLWDFQGISFNANTKRKYHYPVGAHFLGYVLEVNNKDIERGEGYYKMGDLRGKSGLENEYEDTLRGIRGKRVVAMDNHAREVGPYQNGREDETGIKGADLILGIDVVLQAYGEKLMKNKRGSIVAIQPRTGEVLAFVSSPGYNPSMLTGSELGKNWQRLTRDTMKSLLNRPISGVYPPGSIFKPALALVALNEGIITPNTYYRCGGGFGRNKGKPGCRNHPHPLNLAGAIKYSCNAYFAATYMDMLNSPKYKDVYESFGTWRTYMLSLGLGTAVNVDIPFEKRGDLPRADKYDKMYKHGRWGATTIISNAIGQGEITMTPLQMANLAALIANGGSYVEPHFVRGIRGANEASFSRLSYKSKNTHIAAQHFEAVKEGMFQVVSTGTGRRAFLTGYDVCGKTGTVENSHGKDHATFIGFAPRDNPQIAIAIVVENSGGGGGTWAAPIGGAMMELFLTQKVEEKAWEEKRIMEADFIH